MIGISRSLHRISTLFVLALFASVVATPAGAVLEAQLVVLDGEQAGGGGRTGGGNGTMLLDDIAGTLDFDFAYAGMSGIELVAHIHGPAAAGSPGGVLYNLPAGNPKTGTIILTDPPDGGGAYSVVNQIADLRAGLWYVNIHTTTFPGGEIRGHIYPIEIAQISWQDTSVGTSTPNSTWGQVTIEFVGNSSIQRYLNLELPFSSLADPWVVQNMGVASQLGGGVVQTMSTFFPIESVAGPVSSTDIVISLTDFPIGAPSGPTLLTDVIPKSREIGGEDTTDTGQPADPEVAPNAAAAGPTSEGKLANVDKMTNQAQCTNQCAFAAVSNSMKYLEAAGHDFGTLTNEISDWETRLNKLASGRAPTNWPELKKKFFETGGGKDAGIKVDILEGGSMAVLDKVIQALKDGKDVELDMVGHVATVIGMRKYANGKVEVDIYDDDQDPAGTPNKKADGMRTADQSGDGTGGNPYMIDGRALDGYIIECPVKKDPHSTVPGPLDSFADVGTGALPAIPADFFGPGSDPFVGQIALQGATGFVDTVMTRIETPVFPSDPVFTVGFVDIQLEQLDLVSTEPIIVTFNGGQNPELWNVRLGLAPDHSLSPVGSLTATKTHNNGGTFDVEFFVRPVFVLTKPPHTFELSLPELHFQAFGTPWVHNADSSLNLNAPNNGNFVPGVEELAPSVQQLVPMSAQEDTGAVLHTVIPSSGTPVPSSSEWIGALLAATFMVSALAFMRTQRRTA